MCRGGPSRTLRQIKIRDILTNAIQKASFSIRRKHGGELSDGKKAGEIIAYNQKRKTPAYKRWDYKPPRNL